MNRWVARVVALVLAAAAVYLVYANAHAARIVLECALGAAALAIATVVFAWSRPAVASIFNAIWLVAAVLAVTWLSGGNEALSTTRVLTGGTGVTSAVGEVAKDIGSDPAGLLTRVARDVRYEVYPGVFRGPFATMADGAGNDYDRALLLHDMFVTANPGVPVRYAFCTLSPQQADVALETARSAYRAPAVAANAQTLAAKAATQQLRDDYEQLAAFWEAAIAQDRQQTEELAVDFKKAGVQLASPSDPNLRSIAADHVWVQVQRHGGWVDLDPASPTVRPGSSLCTASKTGSALPDSAYDTLTATLHLESRNGGQESDAAIASGTWRTVDLAQTPLMFAFAEPSGLHAPAPQPTGMRAYTPLLVAGTQTVAAAPITVPVPPRGTAVERAASKVAVGGASAAAAFGSSPPVAATATPSPGGPIPVALRLKVSVSAPNISVVTAEHTIFDRISASERAAGHSATAAIAPISTLLPFGTVLNVAASAGTGVVGVGDYTPFDAASNDSANINRALGVMHRAYYTLRRNVFADAIGRSAPPVVSVRPGLSFLGLAPYSAGPVDFGLTMDRAVEGAVPEGGDADSGLAWGVASLYGERLAVAANSMKAFKDKLDELPFDDSIEMFYIARHTNVAPTLVRSGSDVAAMAVPDDVKARVAASIAGGSQAVVPATQVSYGGSNDDGWWILASDGSISDEMQNGMHSAMAGYAQSAEEDAEDAPQEAKKGADSKCVAWAAAALFGAAMAVGGAMGNTESATEIGEKLGEYTHAVYEAKEVEESIEIAERCSEGGGPKGPPPGRGKCPPFAGPYCKP